MKKTNKTVTAAELSRVSGYSPAAISGWTRSGMLRRTSGRYDLAESLEAIRAHEIERDNDGGRDAGELAGLKRQLLEKKIAKLDHELQKLRGEVHSESECSASLAEVLRIIWAEVKALPTRLQNSFPEVHNLEVVARNHVNEAADRIHAYAKTHTKTDSTTPTKGHDK